MKRMCFCIGLLLLCGLCFGCTAAQWRTTRTALTVGAVVGILAIGESQHAYPRSVATDCYSVCTAYACESRCVTR